MRILLFSPKGSGEHYYGPGMNAYRMYKNIAPSSDVSLTLVHGYRDQKRYQIFDDQFFISDIVNKNLYLGVRFLYLAKKWVQSNIHHYDIVHCLTAFHHSFMFSYWSEQHGVPAVIKIGQSSYTGFSENSLASRVLGLNRFRVKHANDITGYVSISKTIKKNLMAAGIEERRIYSIPNGVDTNRFSPVDEQQKQRIRARLGLENKFTVIFTGAFDDRKNPLLIAKAFSGFKERDDIQLLLIGPDLDEGEQRAGIQNLIREQGIKNIILKDFVEEIAPYYKASNLFVLPSKEEGFSNSMLEAQATGLPALVTKISGAVELIDEEKNGTFIGSNESSIYEAIRSYAESDRKLEKQSRHARNIIVEKYSTSQVLERYLGLFSSIKNQKENISSRH